MVQLIVGSMLGASEYVADAIAEFLNTNNIDNRIHLTPDIENISMTDFWIIITSTHGAGDLPDNIQPFAQQLNSLHLPEVSFMVIALGDSSYDTFCEGGKTIYNLLNKAGAKAFCEPYNIDVLEHTIPEDNAIEWFQSVYQDALGDKR